MENFCKVKDCRFFTSHTTKSHKCGNCGKYGHGVLECNNPIMITCLEKYHNEILPSYKWCNLLGCKSKKYHTVQAHHCNKCGDRAHSELECPLSKKLFDIKCPICNKKNTLSENKHIIYGLSEKCKICHTDEINIYLPDCGHACMCEDCMLQLIL